MKQHVMMVIPHVLMVFVGAILTLQISMETALQVYSSHLCLSVFYNATYANSS